MAEVAGVIAFLMLIGAGVVVEIILTFRSDKNRDRRLAAAEAENTRLRGFIEDTRRRLTRYAETDKVAASLLDDFNRFTQKGQ